MVYNCFMKKEIVIFDLDGTLLNTLEDLTDSTNFALDSCSFSKRTLDEVRNFVGNGVYMLIERAVPKNTSKDKIESCLAIFKKHYSNNMYNKTSPYIGILEMLEYLKENGYKIAVVSNKFDSAVKELCEKYFKGFIDYSAGENEAAGIRKKPAPDTVLKVLKNFNLNCAQAVYVGDSEVDILTAKNSKIPCISVTWGFKSKEFLVKNQAKYIAETPQEIIEILKSL